MLTTTAPYHTDETAITTDGGVAITGAGMERRLKATLPPQWFANIAPIRDALFAGVASALSFVASGIAFARRQARVATSTGLFLDLAALDYLGLRVRRRAGEIDDAFQLRIRKEVLRPRVTRAALIAAVRDTTGFTPDFWEPWHTGDTGGVGFGFALAGGTQQPARIGGWGSGFGGIGAGGFAFVTPTPGPSGSAGAGSYGSLEYPDQVFIRAYRAPDTLDDAEGYGGLSRTGRLGGGQNGNPAISGLGGSLGGYGVGSGFALLVPDGPTHAVPGVGAYAPGALTSEVNAEIYQRISETVAAGVVAWTAIETKPAA